MKNTLFFFLVVLFFMVGSITLGVVNNGRLPAISGYEMEANYPVYEPDNLWDYINGAADTYLSYHFVDLRIAEYTNEEGESIKVEIYKHKSSEYAYGIYCSERYPEYNFIEIGVQGYTEIGLVHFVSGPYYVKVISGSETPSENASHQVATEISNWLGRDFVLPKMLSIFPNEGKIEKSECFLSNNFLGHEFLSDAYVARYEVEDQEFKIFIIQKKSPSECVRIIEDYLRFAKMEVGEIDDGQYDIEDRYNGNITLFLGGNLIIGFLDCGDKALVEKYSGLISNNVSFMEK